MALLSLGALASCAQPSIQALPFADASGEFLDSRWIAGEVTGVTPEHYVLSLDHEPASERVGSLHIAGEAPGNYHTIWTTLDLPENRSAALMLNVEWNQYREGSTGQPFVWVRMDRGGEVLSMVDSRDLPKAKPGAWSDFLLQVPVPRETEELVLGVGLLGTGVAQFEDLRTSLGGRGYSSSTSAEAKAYLNDFLEIVEGQALMREQVDWPQMRKDLRSLTRGALTTADTYPAIRFCLSALQDRHSRLLTPAYISAYDPVEEEDGSLSPAPMLLPEWELLEGDIGYLWLPGHLSFDDESPLRFAAEIARGVTELHGCRGIVLDLRSNGGGNMWPMLAGLGPLLGAEVVGSFDYLDGSSDTWWYRNHEAGQGDYPGTKVDPPHTVSFAKDLPIAILTSRWTGSSGEATLVAFLGRPNVRTFGEPTTGLSTGNSSIPLADGAILLLTTSVYADRTGKQYGNRIHPDVVVEVSNDEDAPDVALEQALTWLRS
jgi:carboxyl-terminal processing protease